MKKILFIVLCLIPSQVYATNCGCDTKVRVMTTLRDDGLFFHEIQLQSAQHDNATIDTSVLGHLLQSVLSDPTVIEQNGGNINVNFSSQVDIASLDPYYNPAGDSVFNDGSRWPSIVLWEQLPVFDHDAYYMRAVASTESPLVAGSFFPIWHIVSPLEAIMVVGSLKFQNRDGRIDYFSNVPEPSAIILIILGVVAIYITGRKRCITR